MPILLLLYVKVSIGVRCCKTGFIRKFFLVRWCSHCLSVVQYFVDIGALMGVCMFWPPQFVTRLSAKGFLRATNQCKILTHEWRIPECQSIQIGHLIKFIFYLWFGFFSLSISLLSLEFQWIIIFCEFPMAISVYMCLQIFGTKYVPIYRMIFSCSHTQHSLCLWSLWIRWKKFFIFNIIWYLINREIDNIRWISLQPVHTR